MEYYNNELYHYGVKGMKWGVRRYRNEDGSLNAAGRARQNYKDAKKELKTARRAYRGPAIGIKGITKAQNAEKKVNDASMKVLESKAKFNAAKAKNAEKAQKAEFKTYVKAMGKTGLPGSIADEYSRGNSTRIYDSVKAQKGKEYADKVAKKVQNQSYAAIAESTALAIGLLAVDAYLYNRS